MPRRIALCITLAAIVTASLSLDASLTLAQAIEQARANSPDARLADARVEMSAAARKEADAAQLPHIGIQSSYSQTNSPMNAFGAILNQGTFDYSLDFNNPGQIDNLSTSLYLRQAIYTGGRIRNGRAAARRAQEAAEYDRNAALQGLDLEVVRSYYSINQAENAVAALGATLASYDENLRVAKLREDAGQMLKSERLNIEVQRARIQSQLLAARQQVDLAKVSFAVLLGMPADETLTLSAEDNTTQRITDPGTSAETAKWPELDAMDSRVEAAQRQLSAARADRMPTVGAFASVQDDRGWRRDGDGQGWAAGVAMSMTLFDGNETGAKIAQAKAALNEVEQTRRKVQLALQLRLRQARINHEVAVSQLEVCRQQVAQADESARLSRERFSAGSLLSAELIGVETRLTDARVQLVQSESRERVAMAELRNALALPVLSTSVR